MQRSSIYEAAGGMPAFRRLAAAWHDLAVAAPLVGHAFSHGYRDDHEERLAAYLSEVFGGPPAYTGRYGDGASAVRVHSGNGEHAEMDDEAIRVFADAVETCGFPNDPELRQAIKDYWAWATREVMGAYPDSADDVPGDLTIRRWSWDGPEPE